MSLKRERRQNHEYQQFHHLPSPAPVLLASDTFANIHLGNQFVCQEIHENCKTYHRLAKYIDPYVIRLHTQKQMLVDIVNAVKLLDLPCSF